MSKRIPVQLNEKEIEALIYWYVKAKNSTDSDTVLDNSDKQLKIRLEEELATFEED